MRETLLADGIAWEIADVDGDGVKEIIITDDSVRADRFTSEISHYPDSSTVYKWAGTTYKKIWSGPWEDRLKSHQRAKKRQ